MPIYEFYCPDNNKIYTFFARTLGQAGKIPRCPDHPDFRMQKEISPFAFVGRAKDPSTEPKAEKDEMLDDPRMQQVMAQMEREMAGLDEDNPDPRQLARMLRSMTGIMGDKLPAEMNEMIARMEKGEDPEKLEEEYGDLLDQAMGDDEGALMGASDKTDEETESKARRFLRQFRMPQRDPVLYEMTDYL